MLVASIVAVRSAVSQHAGECIDGGADTTITVQLPAGYSSVSSFSWPPLPPAGAAYGFALERAILALSPACATAAGVSPNADNGPGTSRSLWIGRLDELRTPPKLDQCGCGAAIFLGGSGGQTGDNIRYMAHLAARGFSAVAPDTMAGPAGNYPRHRDTVPSLSESLAAARDAYWCANEVYAGGCDGAYSGGAYPACFSSNADNIRHDPASWAAFYERVCELRRREVDAVVEGFASTFGVPSRLFLFGNSEGAVVASTYSHPLLASLNLVGRILTSWSCEFVYFRSCAAHAALTASPRVPVLNLLSEVDPFFGSEGSIAAKVSAPGNGSYGERPSGSCAAAMRSQGLRGAALKLRGTQYHDNLELGGSLFRHVANRFLADPAGAFANGVLSFGAAGAKEALAQTLCEEELIDGGVTSAVCDALDEFIKPMPPSAYNLTRCGWPSELVRPAFVDFDEVPPACIVGSAAAGAHVAQHMWEGAALGALACLLVFSVGAAYARYAHRLGLAFVRLHEEQPAPLPDTAARAPRQAAPSVAMQGGSLSSPAPSPPYEAYATA